jgi:NAD(P)-dependent dehydrogenase (short-subunit alcohol dehydrogenase family)
MFDYTNKNIVVFGGTSGINLGIALGFASHGANVAVISRDENKVNAAVNVLKEQSNSSQIIIGHTCDVRDADGIKAVAASISQQIGCFDVVVSGAAGNFPALASEMSSNAFKSVIDIDLNGTFHVMQAIYEYLNQSDASVINISAPQSFVAMEFQSHVSAAKAGVDMLTKSLAMEWGAQGIRVNSIVPGPIAGTEGMKRLAPTQESEAMIKDSVPLKRLGTTDDIAQAALFLGSEYSKYISGVILPVDGGWSLSGVSHAMAELKSMYKKS